MRARSNIQSSIAINQKLNNKISDNAMKILNTALIERIKERDNEIKLLKSANEELTAELLIYKTQVSTP
jgi:hypothetical protein